MRFLFRSRVILLLPIIIAVLVLVLHKPSKPHEDVKGKTGIVNHVTVNKNGTITNTLTDSRVEEYGEEAAYESYINGLVDEFNGNSGSAVSVKSIKAGSDELKVVLEFPDAESFSKMNGYPFFFGTLEEAEKSGYDLAIEAVDASDYGKPDGKRIILSDIADKDVRHVIITTTFSGESLNIESPSKIRYLKDAVLLEKKLAAVIDGAESFIVW